MATPIAHKGVVAGAVWVLVRLRRSTAPPGLARVLEVVSQGEGVRPSRGSLLGAATMSAGVSVSSAASIASPARCLPRLSFSSA